MKVVLYGIASCHLCDQAGAMLEATSVTAEYIDIAEDEALLEKYCTRIPVVLRIDTGAELGWPFDESVLAGFLV